jgi:hypothetical protein
MRRLALVGAVVGCLLMAGALVVRAYDSTGVREEGLSENQASEAANELAINVDTDRVVITLHDAPPLFFPASSDSNSPAVWLDGQLALINSDSLGAFISRGESIENLTDTIPIDLPVPGRQGTVWMEAVWPDPEDGTLYGWYHFEPEDLACYPLTAPTIGAAVSYDGGITWEDRGFLLENGYDPDCGYLNDWFVGGNGDFAVILDVNQEYLYFIYSNYLGTPEEVGVAIARSELKDRGQPGTVWKYYRGEWGEPGLGGRSTAIFRSRTGWQGPGVDAFWGPSVHWNSYLGAYVALLNRATDAQWTSGGVHISFSRDLLNWTMPEEILQTPQWYPQVIGLDEGGTDSAAGKVMRVFVGGLSTWFLEFSKFPQEVHDPQADRHDAAPVN